jgi:hypothetical protein
MPRVTWPLLNDRHAPVRDGVVRLGGQAGESLEMLGSEVSHGRSGSVPAEL